MYWKSLSLILFCAVFWASEGLVKCDKLATIGLGFSEKNGWLKNRLPADYYVKNEIVVNRDCGGNLTAAPGKIDLLIKQHGQCTWKIYAPSSHHVLIEEIAVNYDAPVEASTARDNSVIVDIYEGIGLNATKRLHRFGNGDLGKVMSHGKYLTIDMKHDNKSEIYTNHQLRILYHFIDDYDFYGIHEDIADSETTF